MKDYSEIMATSYRKSKNRPQMEQTMRAAQFAPFAALTGYDEDIDDARQKHNGEDEVYVDFSFIA